MAAPTTLQIARRRAARGRSCATRRTCCRRRRSRGAPRRPGSAARPRSASRAASTRSSPARRLGAVWHGIAHGPGLRVCPGRGAPRAQACRCAQARRARAPAAAGASAQRARSCTCGTLAPFVQKVRRGARLRRRDVPVHAGGGQGGRAARACARVLPAGGLARRGVAALAAGPLPGGAGGRGPGQPAGHRGRGAVRRCARRHLPRQADVRAVAAGARLARPGPPVPARVRARASR